MPRTAVRWAALLVTAVAMMTTSGRSIAFGQVPYPRGAGMARLSAPQFQADGSQWARVITATPKWLVLENAIGQQYPVSFGAIDVFVIRWPADPRRATPGTLAEVTGIDLFNGGIVAGHVDLFEGSARALVSPTSLALPNANQMLAPNNFYQMNTFGRIPMAAGATWMPQQRHLVGALVGGNPIMIAPPVGPAAVVLPGAGGMSVTQVTIGSPSFVRPGDLVWFQPVAATPQSLAIGRMVVIKTIPIAQFVP